MYLIFNSLLSLESDFIVNGADRAFQYGDGLFETLRYEQQRIAFWPDHYDRLTRGMTALQLDRPDWLTADALHQQLLVLLARNNLTDAPARIRMQVWRQSGGLYTPATCAANLLATAHPGAAFAVGQKARVGIFDAVRLSPSPVSFVKTTSALPYVLAGLARQKNGFDDIILLDTQGHVAECGASALFWFTDDRLFMPSLLTGCIEGILRRQLLRLAPPLGFRVQEGLFLPAELARADAVFCGNVMGVQRIGAIENVGDFTQRQPGSELARRLDKLLGQLGRATY